MKLTLSPVLALVALAAGRASAQLSCFDAGIVFGDIADKQNVRQHVTNACQGYSGIAGAFQGVYGPNGDTKSACVNVGNGWAGPDSRINMSVKNWHPSVSFDLGDNDCYKEFNHIITHCKRGGIYHVAGWEFYIDPNANFC